MLLQPKGRSVPVVTHFSMCRLEYLAERERWISQSPLEYNGCHPLDMPHARTLEGHAAEAVILAVTFCQLTDQTPHLTIVSIRREPFAGCEIGFYTFLCELTNENIMAE